MRNLDLATLRSFVAVAETGGVTRAARFLHLTQSAVSMQLKRLENVLDAELLDRSGRTIALTTSGEQLLAYARRMIALNDEAITHLSTRSHSGTLRLGVPHDIVYPAIPRVLRQFNAAFPGVRVVLESSHTRVLQEMFGRGECDIILTTETDIGNGGRTLAKRPLDWVGAPGGAAWRQRPLNIAFWRMCLFRSSVIGALDAEGIAWQVAAEADNDSTIHATVGADLAVHAMIEGTQPPHLARIEHDGTLPDLPVQYINLYRRAGELAAFETRMVDLLGEAFTSG
ncbi:LysR family transcriptional regulator [Sulfitobacter sp. HNIBRBA3233]|uniref:LysR family transcriptional regulator n=1 Tax=Sulfitobacter marinivivus TaxID=3158558 RepID=UPI0032DFD065